MKSRRCSRRSRDAGQRRRCRPIAHGRSGPFIRLLIVAMLAVSGIASPTVAWSQSHASITKSITSHPVGTTIVQSGEQFTYTIAFGVSGSVPASGVTVTDVVPPELEVVSVLAGNYSYTVSPFSASAGTTVTIGCGTMAAGSAGQVQINVRFWTGRTCSGTEACNTASISSPDFETVTTDKVCMTAIARNKFTIEKTAVAILPHQVVRWKVCVTNPAGSNLGGYDLTWPTFYDAFPSGAQMIAVTDLNGTPIAGANLGAGSWSSGTLAANQGLYQVCFLVDIQYPSPTWRSGDVVRNCVRMDAGHACQEDSLIRLTSCDTAVLAKVKSVPGMQAAKYLSLGANGAGPFSPGCTGVYSIWYKNTGNTILSNVTIEDALPHEIEVTQIGTMLPGQCSAFEYQTNGVNVWYAHAPAATLNVYGTAGPTNLGLTPGLDYISRVRWTYSTIGAGQQIAYNTVSFNILPWKFDDHNDPTSPADVITNTATADAPGLNTITMVNDRKVDPFAPSITLAKYVVRTCSGFAGPYLPGHIARYRLVVGNYGSADATAFTVTDVLPSYFSYAGNETHYYLNGPWLTYTSVPPCSPSSTSIPFAITPQPGGNQIGASTVGWSIGGLPHDCGGNVDYMVIEFDVRITAAPPAPAASYWNHFTVASQQLGTLTSPDAQLIVNAVTSISTEKQVRALPGGTFGSSATVEPGNPVEYRLRITNTGNQSLDNLRLMDILPYSSDRYVVNVVQGRGSSGQMVLSSAPVASSGSPMIGYHNAGIVCRIPFLPIAADITGCNGGPWSTSSAMGYDKAFRMDFGSWQLAPAAMLDVTFQATAPSTDSTVACNSFGVVGRTVANGQAFPPLEPAPVCVDVVASCTQLIDEKISCRSGDRGAIVYDYCFSIRNNSSLPLYHFDPDIVAPSGATLTPGSLSFWGNPIPPGGVAGPFCFTIAGPGAQAGAWVSFDITASLYDSLLGCVKCGIRDSIRLPDCPLPDTCCTIGKLSFGRSSVMAFVDGTTSLGGSVFIGPGTMQSVSVSLVGCYLNGQPVVGQLVGGMFAGSNGTIQSMHEVRFGQWLPCRDFQNGSGFSLNLKFPPYSNPCPRKFVECPDLLTFCLRFRFVDCKCCQRDTLICFDASRLPMIIWHPFDLADLLRRGHTNKGGGPETQSVGTEEPLVGTLIGRDSGSLRVDFPKPDSASVRFVGMKIRSADSSVAIVGATGDNGSLFVATDGVAFGYFTALPGDRLNIGLKYDDIGDRVSLAHIVTMVYTIDGSTVEEDVPVVFRREGMAGGDVVEETRASITDVRTFALHLRNSNGSAEPIDRIVLRMDSGKAIVGVGPTRNDSVAVLTLGRSGERAVVGEDITGIRAEVIPGETYEPIYLTISGFDGRACTVRFTTLNSDGETVSEGTLALNDPISGIEGGGPVEEAWGTLSQSYPNPTDGTATIEFVLSRSESNVELIVHDGTGREVARLIDHESLEPGVHAVWFDGASLPSGTYFYTLRTDSGTETKSLNVVR